MSNSKDKNNLLKFILASLIFLASGKIPIIFYDHAQYYYYNIYGYKQCVNSGIWFCDTGWHKLQTTTGAGFFISLIIPLIALLILKKVTKEFVFIMASISLVLSIYLFSWLPFEENLSHILPGVYLILFGSLYLLSGKLHLLKKKGVKTYSK